MRPFRTSATSLLACALLLIATIPTLAGDTSGSPNKTPLPSSVPNYAAELDRAMCAWDSFPVRVYFVRDCNYSSERAQCARDGFNRWTAASDGFITYEVTRTEKDAQITVRFNPKSADGVTEQFTRGRKMRKASVTIGVSEGEGADLDAVSAHEFGHALGITGHSDNQRDIMFPVHWAGTRAKPSERDLNTLAMAYPELAKLRADRDPDTIP